MESDTTTALATIRAWDWEGLSRSFVGEHTWGPITRSLSDTVNELAFHWQGDAAGAVLSLLVSGKLEATGNFKWRAFRGEHYQNEGTGEIPACRWRALQEGLTLPRNNDWSRPRVKFDLLDGFGEAETQPVAEWAWQDGRFSTAGRSEGDFLADDYREEWFSAWYIQVRPSAADGVAVSALPAPSLSVVESNRGRRPKWDWEGAMAHVVAVANTPDGLETGHGAQAAIERMMTDYFARASNDASTPVESEIRKRASRIMKAIENLKTGLTKAA